MKNILLSLGLSAICALSANAQSFNDIISFSIDGKPLNDGDKVVVAPVPNFNPFADAYMFSLEVDVDNLTDEDRRCAAKVTAISPDTDTIKDSETYPFAYLCTPSGCLPDRPDNFAEGIITIPYDAVDLDFTLDVHAAGSTELTVEPATYLYELTLLVNEDDSDPKFSFIVEFNPNANSGVSSILLDSNEPAEYFNLQGQRVINPSNGIFIRRTISGSSKVAL